MDGHAVPEHGCGLSGSAVVVTVNVAAPAGDAAKSSPATTAREAIARMRV
jgi:hypothetical protein